MCHANTTQLSFLCPNRYSNNPRSPVSHKYPRPSYPPTRFSHLNLQPLQQSPAEPSWRLDLRRMPQAREFDKRALRDDGRDPLRQRIILPQPLLNPQWRPLLPDRGRILLPTSSSVHGPMRPKTGCVNTMFTTPVRSARRPTLAPLRETLTSTSIHVSYSGVHVPN